MPFLDLLWSWRLAFVAFTKFAFGFGLSIRAGRHCYAVFLGYIDFAAIA
jgi:hypothetical protein